MMDLVLDTRCCVLVEVLGTKCCWWYEDLLGAWQGTEVSSVLNSKGMQSDFQNNMGEGKMFQDRRRITILCENRIIFES